MARIGRPTKLTEALEQAIVAAVAAGMPYYDACRRAGISEHTAREWLARGEGRDPHRPPTPQFARFAAAIKTAEAQDQMRRILRIEQAAKGGAVIYEKTVTFPDGRVVTERRFSAPQWTADAWHLERRWPDRWGRRDRVDPRLTIERVAQEIAEELGMTAEEVLAEAEAYLRGK